MNVEEMIAEAPPAAPAPPTALEVDELVREYVQLQVKLAKLLAKVASAREPLGPAKDKLVELVREFGSAHAEKSKRLYGVIFCAMVTESTSHSTDAAAVERFRLALKDAGQTRLLEKIFLQDIRWVPAPGWEAIVKSEQLDEALLALFSQCDVPHNNEPKLAVDLRENEGKSPRNKKPPASVKR